MKKARLFLVFLVIIALLVGCEQNIQNNIGNEPKNTDYSVDTGESEITELNKPECEKYGGRWNECGSPCAGTDAEFCIQVCQAQCECGGIAGFSCPKGYKCKLSGKKADEIGVCVK